MSEEKKTKKVKVSRDVYEDNYLSTIALNQLTRAKSEEVGYKFRWIIPSMVFSVFRVEALSNIYGSQLFPHWNHFESTSFIGKITMISEFLKLEVDFSKQPWQTFNEMKNFRNILVHAKPQKASKVTEIPDSAPMSFAQMPSPKKSILAFSSIENAERFNTVATDLELMWMTASKNQGHNVDVVGLPNYEVIE